MHGKESIQRARSVNAKVLEVLANQDMVSHIFDMGHCHFKDFINQ